MTLALAMVCEGGLMLATDTRLAYGDGSISHAEKLTGFQSGSATYVIAHSSEDAHAAFSLIGEIRLKLENADPQTFAVLESAVRDVMRKWYVPVYDNRPIMRLLLGASIQGRVECGLYFCEPPNTVTRIYADYKAVGDGWFVSDSIYNCWFQNSPQSPHTRLCQISYLMYKAKQLLPGSIGGDTDVAFLTEPLTVPYWIGREDMANAEAKGAFLDRQISAFASSTISGSTGDDKTILQIAQGIYSVNLLYAPLAFRCQFPDKTIRK